MQLQNIPEPEPSSSPHWSHAPRSNLHTARRRPDTSQVRCLRDSKAHHQLPPPPSTPTPTWGTVSPPTAPTPSCFFLHGTCVPKTRRTWPRSGCPRHLSSTGCGQQACHPSCPTASSCTADLAPLHSSFNDGVSVRLRGCATTCHVPWGHLGNVLSARGPLQPGLRDAQHAPSLCRSACSDHGGEDGEQAA